MAHFAHYVHRKIVEVKYTDPNARWFAEKQLDNQGFHAPSYHVTRSQSGPATRVEKNDTIWLFSQLTSPWGNFPPALDAKILVRGKSVHEAFKVCVTRYEAGATSRWFPLCDASSCIQKLWTKDINSNRTPLLESSEQSIGQALQSMRELDDASHLMEFEREIDAMPLDFISYRLIDGTRLAFNKAHELVKQKDCAVFWDRWTLPRRMAERREFLSEDSLDDYIFKNIHECRTLWAIKSDQYAKPGSYTACEMNLAERLGKLQWVSGENDKKAVDS